MGELDQIPANTDVLMTPIFRRCFLAAGCDPTCHACEKPLKDGETFQLLSYKGNDEMVHPACGIEGLKRRDRRLARSKKERIANGGSGYSRPSKNVAPTQAEAK